MNENSQNVLRYISISIFPCSVYLMLAVSAGRAVGSLIITGGIVGVGLSYKKWSRRNESEPVLPQPSASDLHHPLIEAGDELSPDQLRQLIYGSGKIELHCHLNGSVRKSTMNELHPPSLEDGDGVVHTIEDAFREFKRVYKVVNTEPILRRVVRECLSDAVADGVRYLELRTTPRKLNDITSRRDYVKVVADEIRKFEHINTSRPLREFPRGTIAVRLILTVDRSQPASVAEQTVDIALRFPEIVVGIDFAGNPTVGSFADFLTVFNRAKGHGLYTTVHTSEIQGVDKETDAILDFKPHRIGHFLFPTEEQLVRAREISVAIESCPTSNICAVSGRSPVDGDVNGHSILGRFIRDPECIISINTDDPGVFGVTLSGELLAVATTFKLSKVEVLRMLCAPAKHAFLHKQEREALADSVMNSWR